MPATQTIVRPIAEMFRLQTKLFHNVTKDITEDHAGHRFMEVTNHMAWITGHLVSTRFSLGTLLGMPYREPFPELFARGKGLDETIKYPSFRELIKDWDAISDPLVSRIENLKEWELEAEAPVPSPMTPINQTLMGFIMFIAHHEAYHIGQLGLARRLFNYEPMGYS